MENINDSIEEAVVAEEVIEAPVQTVAEEVTEAPVIEPVIEEKPKAKKADKPSNTKETVALYAKGNFVWEEVGKLTAGYNIVLKTDADKWLTIKGVRLATPEEILARVNN